MNFNQSINLLLGSSEQRFINLRNLCIFDIVVLNVNFAVVKNMMYPFMTLLRGMGWGALF